VIIAGAGGAAHLPGMAAAMTPIPVLGVPVNATVLNGVDALLSIAQMPKGIPVATFAIGAPGAVNAGLFAAAMLATQDDALAARLDDYRALRRWMRETRRYHWLRPTCSNDGRGGPTFGPGDGLSLH